MCTLCALDGEGRAHPGVLAGQFLPQGDSGLFDAAMENDARPIAECLPQQCGAGERQCPLTHFTSFLSVTQASCSDPFSPCL